MVWAQCGWMYAGCRGDVDCCIISYQTYKKLFTGRVSLVNKQVNKSIKQGKQIDFPCFITNFLV